MKKGISLLLGLLLVFLLAGCSEATAGNALYNEMSTAPQTNESLTVYCLGNDTGAKLMLAALNRYKQLYPEVEVELIQPLTEFKNNTDPNELMYYEQLSAQIMAGEGPDVLLFNEEYIDVEKFVRQGIFADMEPFFQADGFEWEPYNQGVMDSGVWNGKRFVIPLGYTFPLLCTTKEALEETGFDVEACKDFQGFLDETTRYMENPSQTRRLFSNALDPNPGVVGFFDQSGASVVDYDKQIVDLSLPLFTSTVQWYKTVIDTHPWEVNSSLVGGAAAVRDGQALWTTSVYGADFDLFGTAGALRTVGEAVTMPIRDINGGIHAWVQYPVAVRSNSENLRNAYNFLKILLSPEIQYTNNRRFSVLHSATEHYLTQIAQEAWVIKEGTEGFISTNHPGLATDAPSHEEIQQLLALTREINGAYYQNNNTGAMYTMGHYLLRGADFGETLKKAQQQLEIYISE